jgi:hypothetical protein
MCIYDVFHIVLSSWHTYGSMEYVRVCVRVCVCVCVSKYSTASLARTSYFNNPTSCGRMRKQTKPVQVKPNATPNVAEHNKTYTARKELGLLTAMSTREYIASNQLHNTPTCPVSMIVNSFFPSVRNGYNDCSKIPLICPVIIWKSW